ncbi:MAG: RNA-guided pseudouridylation complex pseudouridine synthase subunit Cbf5 [Thermoplasmata archaeon]
MNDTPPATPPFPAVVQGRIGEGAFLLVDKPRGPTSHQVAAWVRDLLGVERAGHAGTLDPHVSGLLWVGVGPALKLLPLLLDFPKRYIAVIDLHGRVPAAELAAMLAEFQGPIFQTPPVRSAVRRERRVRTIHRLTLLEREGPHLLVDATCESGTYIRSLAVDLGEALGVGAHLAELRRVGTGPFKEEQSTSLHGLADAVARAQGGSPDALLAMLHPIEEVRREFPQVLLKPGAAAAVAHGAGVARGGIRSVSRPFPEGALVVLIAPDGAFLGVGEARVASDQFPSAPHGWVIESRRVMVDSADYERLWDVERRARPPASTTESR